MGFASTVTRTPYSVTFGFEHDGSRFALSCEPGDPHFYMLMTAYGLGAEGLDEAELAIRARDVNSMLKAVKVIPVPEDRVVRFGIEQLADSLPPSADVLTRAIELLHLASHEFFRGTSPAAVLKVSRRARDARARKTRRR